MKENIDPLSNNTIQNILKTAQALIGRSTLALERENPRSRQKHPSSNTYTQRESNSSITWISNIFDICDISILQFDYLIDTNNCINLCNSTMEIIKPNLWIGEDTIIQFYEEASGQKNFLVGWKHSCLLR